MSLSALIIAASTVGFEPCRLRDPDNLVRVDAECGRLEVPVDHAVEEPEDETLELRVARLPATRGGSGRGESEKPPMVLLAGGPGQAATEAFVAHARAFRPLRAGRELILVDQRGTGGSAALECPEEMAGSGDDLEQALGWARECAAHLEAQDIKAGHYLTRDAVADLEAVREALGHEEWVLYGVSYGTRVAQQYLRAHEVRVAAFVLDGVLPADEALGPMIGPFAQRALDLMFKRCREDEVCAEAFPELEADFESVLEALETQEREVEIRHPRSNERTTVELDRGAVAQHVRFSSYLPESLALIPLLIHRAAHDEDWGPLAAQVLLSEEGMEGVINYVLHFSVLCSEDAPFIGLEDGDPEHYLGEESSEMIAAMCELWPRGEIAEDFHEPVESDRPGLLLSGELDPVTPPQWGEQAAQGLTGARHLEVAGKGHGVGHLGCMPRILNDFLEARDPEAPDIECLERMRPTPFFLDFYGPAP